jgi:hypothetical protein
MLRTQRFRIVVKSQGRISPFDPHCQSVRARFLLDGRLALGLVLDATKPIKAAIRQMFTVQDEVLMEHELQFAPLVSAIALLPIGVGLRAQRTDEAAHDRLAGPIGERVGEIEVDLDFGASLGVFALGYPHPITPDMAPTNGRVHEVSPLPPGTRHFTESATQAAVDRVVV